MKTRTITAIILIAITIPFLALGGFWTVAFMCAIVVGGVIEVLRVRGIRWPAMVYILTIAGSLGMLLWLFIVYAIQNPTSFFEIFTNKEVFLEFQKAYKIQISAVYIGFYLAALLLTECFSARFTVSDVFYVFTLSLLLGIAGQVLIYLRFNDIRSVIYIFLGTYACDTFALLSGKYFGKHKLAPVTSPKKTWEGAIGGVLMSTIISFGFYCIWPFAMPQINGGWCYLTAFILSVVLGCCAVIGDLIFSSIKRHFEIKDFGSIFPGHGGILDRVDSLLFNLIAFICVYAIATGGLLFLG